MDMIYQMFKYCPICYKLDPKDIASMDIFHLVCDKCFNIRYMGRLS